MSDGIRAATSRIGGDGLPVREEDDDEQGDDADADKEDAEDGDDAEDSF